MNLRALARNRPCLVRLTGICNHDDSTTVLAHVRMAGLSGMGIKAPDLFGAYACSACHSYVDTHHDDATARYFFEGVFRTQALLLKEGKIKA